MSLEKETLTAAVSALCEACHNASLTSCWWYHKIENRLKAGGKAY